MLDRETLALAARMQFTPAAFSVASFTTLTIFAA